MNMVATLTRHSKSIRLLRALPERCLEFTAPDDCFAPLIRRGDRIAIDVCDCDPEDGALYLRRYCPPGRKSSELTIVEAILRPSQLNRDGYWWLGEARRSGDPATFRTAIQQRVWADGPFDPDVVQSRIVGRVVAIVSEDADPQEGTTEAASDQGGAYVLIAL